MEYSIENAKEAFKNIDRTYYERVIKSKPIKKYTNYAKKRTVQIGFINGLKEVEIIR